MRVVLFGHGGVAVDIGKMLGRFGDRIVGLVTHPHETRGQHDLAASIDHEGVVLTARELSDDNKVDRLMEAGPDVGLSVHYGYLLKKKLFDRFPQGCVNLHPGLSPFNRGTYTNVWSIIEETPAGVTLHYIDEGVDTGDVIAQNAVEVEPVDTAKSLYEKLQRAEVELFREAWPVFREGKAPRIAQDLSTGTTHRDQDLRRTDQIDLEKTYVAKDLINILRARTFPPYPGAYFEVEGRRVHARIQLSYDPEG